MATYPKPPLPQQQNVLNMMLYGMERLLGQSGLPLQDMSSPSFLPIPSLLAAGAEWKKEKALTAGKHYSTHC